MTGLKWRIRPVSIELGVMKYAEGSALIKQGDTHVLVSASVEDRVPPFAKEQGQGWLTAEYAMLPRSTLTRKPRESTLGKVSGRTQEIQRLIGRALRSVTDLEVLRDRTIWIDCDVLQADGGTRTASVTAACVAVAQAMAGMVDRGSLPVLPMSDLVAALSVGIVDGDIVLDLAYEQDSRAQVDMNIVMTAGGKLVEVQGTGEQGPFALEQMEQMIAAARVGLAELFELQRRALGRIAELVGK
jgi:ribonuclease PH